MDLKHLDHQLKITPFLARLYDQTRIEELAESNRPEQRVELTNIITELLEMELSPRESELVADVLVEIVRQAETDLKEALAERFSVMDNVPLRLILFISNEEINVAGHVLRKSPILSDLDLIYIIKSKAPQYWAEIAKRDVLSAQVIEVLAETEDLETAISLAENKKIKLTERALTVMADIARESDRLAMPLLRRDEISHDIVKMLYSYVGMELRAYISRHYDIDVSEQIRETVDSLIREDKGDEGEANYVPSDMMLRLSKDFQKRGSLDVHMMLGTLRRGELAAFVAQFSVYVSMTHEQLLALLQSNNGDVLVALCKVNGIIKNDFISIYLLTNRIRNKGKMVELKNITYLVSLYEKMSDQEATDLLKSFS